MTLAPVPSLDQVAGDPTLVRALPHHALVDLCLQAQSVLTACWSALLPAMPASAPIRDTSDRLLTVAQAAPKLGLAKSTLYTTRRRYPFYVEVGGRPRFSEQGIAEFIRMQQQQSGA